LGGGHVLAGLDDVGGFGDDATDARRCFEDFGLGYDRGRGRLRRASGLGGLGGLRRFGRLGGLFRLNLSTKSVGVGPTSNAVGLGVLNRRRGARGTYAEFLGERE
jgi:hypothetical protein